MVAVAHVADPAVPVLEIRNLVKRFGAVEVLQSISIDMKDGDFLVLVGPSGCGKSTLLNCIAGLDETSGGQILIAGRDVTKVPPRDRDIAMVFQSYALYPTMTVAENIGFGMKVRHVPKPDQEKKIAEVAKLLQITHLLERIHPKTLVVNDPASVRNAPEKVWVLEFQDLMPPTLVTRNAEDVAEFRQTYKDIIIKPLYGNGGASVFRIQEGDSNLNSLVELFQTVFREPFMVQQYRPEVRFGDKRIILIDGEVAGAINRVPADGETRSNMHVGGTPKPTDLTPRDLEICARLGPELKARGLLFTGIDVIGPYLTEINVTSPTGIRQVKAFGGNDIAAMIWDSIERKAGSALP